MFSLRKQGIRIWNVVPIWSNLTPKLDDSVIHIQRTGPSTTFLLMLKVLMAVGFGCLFCGLRFVRGNMRGGNGETERRMPALCLCCSKGGWRTQQHEEKEEEGGHDGNGGRQCDRWCNTAPMWEDLDCQSGYRSSASLTLSWQPCVCPSAQSHYMHLPCSTPATGSRALLWVRLYVAFSLDPLSGLKPHRSNLWHIPSLFTVSNPLPVNFHVSQQNKSNRGAKSLSGRQSGREGGLTHHPSLLQFFYWKIYLWRRE